MNFNFNFGEHYHEGGGSFWTNVLIAFIGAFLGLLFALLVNRIFEKRGKQNQEEIKKALNIERIRYLGIILKSTIKTAKEQVKHYFDLAELVKQNPLEAQIPIQLASYDVWRLRNLDSIELFDSYINIFNNAQNKTKDYKNIFGQGDYIYEKLNEAKNQNERHRNFQHKDELFVRDCIEEIYIRIGLRIKHFQVMYDEKAIELPEFNYLRKFEDIYKPISEGLADFTKIRDEYFKPLNETILNNIQEFSFADSLFTIVKKALSRMRNIEFNALEFAKDMEMLENETQKSIEYLDKQIEEIEKKIEL